MPHRPLATWEVTMAATVAAVLFGLALIFELFGISLEGLITPTTLALAGLTALALHVAGYGSGRGGWRRGRS